MRAVWVDEGNDPDWAKLARYGITGIGLSARDSRTTPERIAQVAAKGLDPILYRAASWTPKWSGAQFADLCSGDITRLCPGTVGTPAYCADVETHDAGWITQWLGRWRKVRGQRVTHWTMEGLQGPRLASIPSILPLLGTHVKLFPESYAGDMTPWAPDVVALDLARVLPVSVYGGTFYDARIVDTLSGWQGYMFTQGRLP